VKKAVLFDLDDTLLWDARSVQEAFRATCDYAAEKTGVDPVALEEAVRGEARAIYEAFEAFPFTKMIGINPFEGLWARFAEGQQQEFRQLEQFVPSYRKSAWTKGLAALGVNDEQLGAELGEMFPAERRKRPLVYEETFEVLKKLQGSYKLLLLTNGSPDLQREKLAGVPELAPYFDHIIISGEFGRGKPDVTIFQHALEKLELPAEACVMVGDKLTTDILGANTAGIDSVWINREGVNRNDDIIPTYTIKSLNELFAIIEA